MLSINPDEKGRKENSGQPAYPCGSGAIRKDHYDLVEINPAATNWIERQKNLKASLIMQHKPELLGQGRICQNQIFIMKNLLKIF